MIAKSADSDTLARSSTGRSRLSGMTLQTRRRLSQVSKAALLLAAVCAVGWLAVLATGRRESAHEAVEARQRALQVAAQFASSEILKEINHRFDILNKLASDNELRQQQRIRQRLVAEDRGFFHVVSCPKPPALSVVTRESG